MSWDAGAGLHKPQFGVTGLGRIRNMAKKVKPIYRMSEKEIRFRIQSCDQVKLNRLVNQCDRIIRQSDSLINARHKMNAGKILLAFHKINIELATDTERSQGIGADQTIKVVYDLPQSLLQTMADDQKIEEKSEEGEKIEASQKIEESLPEVESLLDALERLDDK